MKWSLAAIAQACRGRLLGPDNAAEREITGITTDSRQSVEGQLFVALKGERFDAHDFLADVASRKAGALLVQKEAALPTEWLATCPAIAVDDTRLALGQLAAAWRQQFELPVIAVTGSNGKTTTKEMIAAILRAAFGEAVLATRGNLNNDIGLPLTLLGLEAHHRAAVIEMGMNHPGEIAALAAIGRPTVAIVTNAQRAHLEGMGDLTEVAREKGSLFGGLTDNGIAVINADDSFAHIWRQLAGTHRTLEFALDHPATLRGEVRLHGLDTELSLNLPSGRMTVQLAVPGRHNARNALAAAAACFAAGVSGEHIAAGLSAFTGVKGRLQRRAGQHQAVILDDTYNANPDSVRAGIDVLAATIGHKILVLGDMGEIGEASAQYHDEIGGYAKSQGIDRLLALGDNARLAARNFGEGGQHFCQVDKLVTALGRELKASATANTTVLIKGSRFMRMERVSDAIAAECQDTALPASPATNKEKN